MIPLRPTGGGMVLGAVAALVSFVALTVVAMAAHLHDTFVAAVLIPTVLVAFVVPRVLGSSSLTLEEDGLLLREGRRRTFVSFRALRSVGLSGLAGLPGHQAHARSFAMLLLQTTDGKERAVNTRGSRASLEALVTRIEEARARHRATDERSLHGELLARGDRTVTRWRAELEGGAHAFRSMALPAEELALVLDDPHALPDERVGAALALRGASRGAPAEASARIRVAAASTQDRSLRVALELLAEDEVDDTRLEAALRARRR